MTNKIKTTKNWSVFLGRITPQGRLSRKDDSKLIRENLTQRHSTTTCTRSPRSLESVLETARKHARLAWRSPSSVQIASLDSEETMKSRKRGRPHVAKANRCGKHVRVLTTEAEHAELKRTAVHFATRRSGPGGTRSAGRRLRHQRVVSSFSCSPLDPATVGCVLEIVERVKSGDSRRY
jgi:hypothetical protein